jgi:hypothetical protein
MTSIHKAKSFSKGVKHNRIEIVLPYDSLSIHERAKHHHMAIVPQCNRRFAAIWRRAYNVWKPSVPLQY